jgi:tRNA-splicing ligase RtcB
MMERVKECIQMHIPATEFGIEINKAHNFAAIENHFGQNVVIHRKGATPAFKGELGIIPGSQGTHSYIVSGLGNKESFKSCSHGAGRMMGRAEAKRKLDFDTEVGKLEDLGVIHSIRSEAQLDEAAGAYKDISVVIANQIDLVDVQVGLTPIAVIKG